MQRYQECEIKKKGRLSEKVFMKYKFSSYQILKHIRKDFEHYLIFMKIISNLGVQSRK